jgi:hypothetical protein
MKNSLRSILGKFTILAVLGFMVLPVQASSIFLSDIVPNPDSIDRTGDGELFVLDVSYTDWLLGTGNKKSGSLITFDGGTGSGAFEANYPDFTYTNGTSPTAATAENSSFRYTGAGAFTISIPVPIGTGQITLWLGGSEPGDSAVITADFADTGAVDFSGFFGNTASGTERLFLDYSSDSAQTMTIALARGANTFAGYFAVAVVAVPEPSSALLVGSALAILGLRSSRRRNPSSASRL